LCETYSHWISRFEQAVQGLPLSQEREENARQLLHFGLGWRLGTLDEASVTLLPPSDGVDFSSVDDKSSVADIALVSCRHVEYRDGLVMIRDGHEEAVNPDFQSAKANSRCAALCSRR
jgi:hypothetical protein